MLSRTLARRVYHQIHEFIRDEDGGPLVEFTILAPMFFIIMFGVIEWGNIFFVENNMLIAARGAVRAAAVGTIANTSTAAISAACGTKASPTVLTGNPYTYTFTYSTNVNCTGVSNSASPSWGNVTLQITTPLAKVSLLNYLNMIAPATNLSVSASMQQEYVCPAAAPTPTAVSQKC
jgi:Flp pilus assembly protein TadG